MGRKDGGANRRAKKKTTKSSVQKWAEILKPVEGRRASFFVGGTIGH